MLQHGGARCNTVQYVGHRWSERTAATCSCDRRRRMPCRNQISPASTTLGLITIDETVCAALGQAVSVSLRLACREWTIATNSRAWCSVLVFFGRDGPLELPACAGTQASHTRGSILRMRGPSLSGSPAGRVPAAAFGGSRMSSSSGRGAGPAGAHVLIVHDIGHAHCSRPCIRSVRPCTERGRGSALIRSVAERIDARLIGIAA